MTGNEPEKVKVSSPETESLLEQHLVNGDKNAKTTHALLEHHLVKGDEHAKKAEQHADNHLEMQGKILQEIKKGNEGPKISEMSEPISVILKAMKGEAGKDGETPVKGIHYNDGAPGKDGKDGRDGLHGKDGLPGREGKDGRDGFDGKDGKDGEPGPAGPSGWNGRDATPLLVEEVIEKLRSLPTDKKLSIEDLVNNMPQFSRVGMAGAGYLREQGDVDTTGLLDGQVLAWKTSKAKWQPQTIQTGPRAVLTIGFTSDCDYVCDGVSDQVQIQAALNALQTSGGGSLFFKAGQYIIDASSLPITIPSYVNIIGEGFSSHIKAVGPNIIGMFTNKNNSTVGNSNIYIANLRLEINQSTGFPSNNNQEVLQFNGASWVTVENVYFTNGGVLFQPLLTYNSTSTCLTNGNSAYNVVRGCKFDSSCLVSVVFSQSSHCIATDNICHGYDSPIAILGAWNDILIANNEIYAQSLAGQGIEANNDPGLEAWTDLRIIGNYVHDSFVHGIQITGDSGSAFVDGIVIMGNTITNSGNHGISIEQNIRGFIISGNKVNNSFSTGITIVCDTALIQNGVIANNIIYNNGQGAARPYGIELRTATTPGAIVEHLIIEGNQVYDNQGSPTTTIGIRMNSENSGDFIRNILIVNNDVQGIATPFSFTGAGTIQGISVKNNIGINPDLFYSQGNITGAISFAVVNGSKIKATLTGSITVTLSNGAYPGDLLELTLIQDSSGSRTVSWPGNFKKAGGSLVLSTAAGSVDVVNMMWDGSNWNELSRALNVS